MKEGRSGGRAPAHNVYESSPSTGSTPTGANSSQLNGSSPPVLPSSPPSSRKRGAVSPDISETPSKAMVLSGALEPVCLDIQEDDTPRKIALKRRIRVVQKQLQEERRKTAELKRKYAEVERKTAKKQRELEAMKKILKRAIDFGLCCVTIDAPLGEDRGLTWHARPALMGPQ
ncbi:uncharacterized protein LOC117652990 [Thrips palmi]|uniref:Uncharacterized protein LOC117652990 n=1 Tax=Thrips palmi TaxID=161013 RepID=A0A6P9A9I2_THRPL|nr:uncharacterized protein LOC117652990 [Thrips palmi]